MRRWPHALRAIGELVTLAVAGVLLGVWCSLPDTAKLAVENPTTTAFIDLRRDDAADAGKRFELRWQWRPLGRISRYLRAAVVYCEDIHFYTHDGVDWDALESAAEKDLGTGALKVGGSTITQQLAKNLYLSPQRSVVRKLREILIAFRLEDHLTKQRILELYLNVVEWGDGVFGAEAAAERWFGHSAQTLSPAEAARLAIALPNPIARAPTMHSEELMRKAVRVVRLFRMQGLIDATQERDALDQLGAPDERVLPDREQPPRAPPDHPAGELPAREPPREPPPRDDADDQSGPVTQPQ